MGSNEQNNEAVISNKEIYELLKNVIRKNDELQKQNEAIKEELKQEIRNINKIIVSEFEELKKENNELKEENKHLKNRILANERKSRKYNLILYGKPEEENLTKEIETFLELVNDKFDLDCRYSDIRDLYRIGAKTNGKNRPIFIEFASYQLKSEILTNARKLKGTGLSITHDYIPEDYQKRKVLYTHLKSARLNKLEATIKNNVLIVNGEEFTYEELVRTSEEKPQQLNDNAHESSELQPPATEQIKEREKVHEYFAAVSGSGNKKRKQSSESENPLKRSARLKNK